MVTHSQAAGVKFVSYRNKSIRCPGYNYVVIQTIRSITLSILIAVLCLHLLPPVDAHALMDSSGDANVPALETFIRQVQNGQAGELIGIYIPNVLANRIVQQPSGNNEFVSPWENIITQFSLASGLGSIGLIAHNDLAGKSFALLKLGQEIDLVYGDGRTSTFIVSEVLQYQALDANSISSTFMDVRNQSLHTAAGLFTDVYNRPGTVVLQTCITAGDNPSWGRLFIIAKPVTE